MYVESDREQYYCCKKCGDIFNEGVEVFEDPNGLKYCLTCWEEL